METGLRLSDFDIYLQQHLSDQEPAREESLLSRRNGPLPQRHRTVSERRCVDGWSFLGRCCQCVIRVDLWPSDSHVRGISRCSSCLTPRSANSSRLPHWLAFKQARHWNLPHWPYRRPNLHGYLQRSLFVLYAWRLCFPKSVPYWDDMHVRYSRRPGLARWNRNAHDQQRHHGRVDKV